MFADVAAGAVCCQGMAHVNPLRWSGTLSLEQCISDLKEVQAKGNRPIRLKVPAGVRNRKELVFPIVQEAINHLLSGTVYTVPIVQPVEAPRGWQYRGRRYALRAPLRVAEEPPRMLLAMPRSQ